MPLKADVARELPVIFIDDSDFKTGVEGLGYTDITCKYRKDGQTAWTTKTLASGDFHQIGDGNYTIDFTAGELDTTGLFEFIAQAPSVLDYRGLYELRDSTNDDLQTDIDDLQLDTAQILVDIADIPSDVWDEILTGATHNIQTSAGKRLREISSHVLSQNMAQAGNTTNTIILASNEPSYDGAYDPAGILIYDGTGKGQTRMILEYEGSTRKAVVDRDWKIIPDDTSEYIVFGDAGREHVNEGLAQAGASLSITLNALASSFDDAYVDQEVFIRSGTGADQVRRVTAYDGTTKVATVDVAWDDTPDTTSAYVMLPRNSTSTILSGQTTIKAVVDDTNTKVSAIKQDNFNGEGI